MTQPATAPDPAPQDVDTLQKMIVDITADRSRLKKTPPQDVAGVARELTDTIFEYMTDLVLEMQKQRDWTIDAMEELDQEIDEVKTGAGTQFMPEDAEKFRALAQGVDFLITQLTGAMTNIPPEVAAELAKLKKLAGECLEMLDEQTLEIEDEPEGGDDEGEEGEEGRVEA